jgi:hypothetical protein
MRATATPYQLQSSSLKNNIRTVTIIVNSCYGYPALKPAIRSILQKVTMRRTSITDVTRIILILVFITTCMSSTISFARGGGGYRSGGGHSSSSHSTGSHSSRSYSSKSYSPRASSNKSSYRQHTSRASYGVQRDSKGKIKRSSASKHDFMKQSGYPNGRPGYVIDHIVPLKRGGSDTPSNMQWQTKAEGKAKDKWE